MSELINLKGMIESRSANLAVVGLGYVGIPVAALFAQAGFKVLGVDIQKEKIALLNQGKCPIEGKEPGLAELVTSVGGKSLTATTDYRYLKEADIITISVETPVDDKTKRPRYVALKAAVLGIGENLKPGSMVIVESTIAPRTMEDVVLPILEEASGLKVNEGFFLVHCPERVMPGKLIQNIRNCDRVIGASSPAAGEAAKLLYATIVKANLDVTDLLTAEIVKTAENAYRDVQIAFANELGQICESLGADFWKVRELVNKSPSRNVHKAGAGVGGHCITKDSWLLISSLDKSAAPIIRTARGVNEGMPLHMAKLVLNGLAEAGITTNFNDRKVAVLGYAYLDNSDDTRNSPSAALVEALEPFGFEVSIHDPYVSDYKGNIEDTVAGADALVIMVAHDDYFKLDWPDLVKKMRTKVLVDGRHVLTPDQVSQLGVIYRAIGVGNY